MALTFTRSQIIADARMHLGASDSSKGGPTDAEILPLLNHTISSFVAEAGALKTVIKLSTKANDKYLPLVDEILWPITVGFIDSDGNIWPLRQVEVAPRPGSLGQKPECWWLTAVNVPDASGPSTRTIGIDPYVNVNGTNNIILEAIQLTAELTAGTSIPEIHVSLQGALSYCLALNLLPVFPEKLNLEGYLERQRARAMDLFKRLARGQARSPRTGKDVMEYRRRCRSRF